MTNSKKSNIQGSHDIAEKLQEDGGNYEQDIGCWLLDSESMTLRDELSPGHSFQWSSSGDRIAFLVRAEELWIYDVNKKSSTKLAHVMHPQENNAPNSILQRLKFSRSLYRHHAGGDFRILQG